MSWHFLQGQEAASWEGTSLDGAPAALLKLMPTQEESFLLANGTECSRPFRSFREVIEAASDESLLILRDDFDDNGDLLPAVATQ